MIGLIAYAASLIIWLLYETDWLRVNLMPVIIPEKRKSWDELKPTDYQLKKHHPFFLKCPDNMAPLCGWDWLNNTMHIIPEVKIELIDEHSHFTFRTERTDLLRDAFGVWRNPFLKVKIKDAQHY